MRLSRNRFLPGSEGVASLVSLLALLSWPVDWNLCEVGHVMPFAWIRECLFYSLLDRLLFVLAYRSEPMPARCMQGDESTFVEPGQVDCSLIWLVYCSLREHGVSRLCF